MKLENDTGSDSRVIVGKASDMDRIVIDLDRTDLEMIVDPDVETTAKCSGKTGIRNRFVAKARRTSRTGCSGTRQFGEFRTSIRGPDHRMSEWLPRAAVPVVFYLNTA